MYKAEDQTPETMVKEFRKAFNLPVSTEPRLLDDYDTALHMSLIKEEMLELVHAVNDQDIVEIFDALTDLKYVIEGMGVQMGLPMDWGFEEVHASNMSKLGTDGQPLYHDGTEGPVGKVKKGPNFKEPNLSGGINLKRAYARLRETVSKNE